MQWLTPVISILERLGQEDYSKFSANLGSTMSSSPDLTLPIFKRIYKFSGLKQYNHYEILNRVTGLWSCWKLSGRRQCLICSVLWGLLHSLVHGSSLIFRDNNAALLLSSLPYTSHHTLTYLLPLSGNPMFTLLSPFSPSKRTTLPMTIYTPASVKTPLP